MKTVWICMVLAAMVGTSVAWAINYNKYAHRDAEFGPLTWDRSVTAENVAEIIVQDDQFDLLPKAEVVGDTLYDFGVMGPNDTSEHTFVIKNTGRNTLSLDLGATTCKCTLGSLGKDTLEPGEQTDVKLTWTVQTNKDVFSQSAEIRTNDPAQLILKLEVVGRVIRQIAWVPDAWTFGEVAAGEGFEVGGKLYSYFDEKLIPTKHSFGSKELTDLSEFEVKEFKPGEDDGAHSTAIQGFEIIAKVKPGMRQGAVAVDYTFGFQRKDADGEVILSSEDDTDPNDYASVDLAGRIVGPLSMIVGTKLREVSGSYIYSFGKLGADDSLKAKAFVVLKGSERDKTKLNIGKVTPEGILKAKFGEPISRGTMVLYPLELEIVAGDKPLDYMGKSRKDFGTIWIESDNPKVARMRLAVKFAVDPRP